MPTVYQGSISLAKVKDGEGGTPGTNTATVYLYQRAATTPQKPNQPLTYTFSTGMVSGSTLGNWKQNIAELTGTNPIYFILAVASSTGTTDTIESGDWKGPTILAENGQNGRGVDSVVMKFINWATNTEAQKPTTSTSGWSENVPVYNSSKPYYYVWVRTNYNDNSTPTDEIYLDNGLSDANRTAATANSISQAAEENAQGALSVAQETKQYFWHQSSNYSIPIPAGTYITQVSESSFKSNYNNQPNLLLQSDRINLRNGADVHAQLTSTGLNVLKGGVRGGTIGQPNGIYLSTESYGSDVTINEHQASDWKEIIGTKFGVDSYGNLYASGGEIGSKGSSILVTEEGINISGTNVNLNISNIDNAINSNSWLSDYGEFAQSTDTEVNLNKQYYEQNNGYALTKDTSIIENKNYYTRREVREIIYEYSLVAEPRVEDINTYYEEVSEGVYRRTTDTQINPNKNYYTQTAVEVTTYIYDLVANPVFEDLGIYYETTILYEPVSLTSDSDPTDYFELVRMTRTVSDYIDTHLIANNEGLWVTSGNVSKYRLLVASDGVYLYGPNGLISTFGENINFNSDTPQHIGGVQSYINFIKDNQGKEHLQIVSDDITLGGRDALERIQTFESVVPDIEEQINTQEQQINIQGEHLSNLLGYVQILDGNVLRVGHIDEQGNTESYVEIDGGEDLKVAINVDGNDIAYMNPERFYAPSAVVTNLYMKSGLGSSTVVGEMGWIMRSNGHLSLKRLK